MLENATIANNGKLIGKHSLSLKPLLSQSSKKPGYESIDKRTVLLLGSGMVAGPLVQRLTQRPDIRVVVGKLPFFSSEIIIIIEFLLNPSYNI